MTAQPLRIEAFGAGDALDRINGGRQAGYLRCYFADLNAASIVEEQHYFDRDYLAEFIAFYGTSARQYGNLCKRLHFFSHPVTRDLLRSAVGGSTRARKKIETAYLGFVVVRPIPSAPFGRVVVPWYPDPTPATPRIVEPSRDYECHLAGLTLRVRGLAWQQQDTAVGACATVALWTALHSSAFDATHAIPTTADITRSAHRTASLGSRVFPSKGLTFFQICEAIKESGLAPVVMDGNIKDASGRVIGFTRERFASSCASFIRSGYPVILSGLSGADPHAVCVVGYREPAAQQPASGTIEFPDASVKSIYLHDDNIGPNVRFEIDKGGGQPLEPVELKRVPPQPRHAPVWPDPTSNWPPFTPRSMIAAVHEGLRTSPDALHEAGLRIAMSVRAAFAVLAKAAKQPPWGLTLSTRFISLPRYLGLELGRTLQGAPQALQRARLGLAEKVPPMSLHLGVVRIGVGATPFLDILHDTTDSDRNLQAFCHLVYNPLTSMISQTLHTANFVRWGQEITAY